MTSNPDLIRLIRDLTMQSRPILVRIHRDRGHPELTRSTGRTNRDLTTIGNQQLAHNGHLSVNDDNRPHPQANRITFTTSCTATTNSTTCSRRVAAVGVTIRRNRAPNGAPTSPPNPSATPLFQSMPPPPSR